MRPLDKKPGKINSAFFVFEFTIQRRVTFMAGLFAEKFCVNKLRSHKTFIHQAQIKSIFFHKMIVMDICFDDTVLCAGGFILCIIYSGSIIGVLKIMWQVNSKSS